MLKFKSVEKRHDKVTLETKEYTVVEQLKERDKNTTLIDKEAGDIERLEGEKKLINKEECTTHEVRISCESF